MEAENDDEERKRELHEEAKKEDLMKERVKGQDGLHRFFSLLYQI